MECAAQVFTSLGYRRTQMADVAKAMGVAPGTLYLYVESKEALFDLVARRAFLDEPVSELPSLPIPTPAPGATLRHLTERIAGERSFPLLDEALARAGTPDARSEIDAILRQAYDALFRRRRAIKLMDRSALDYPELAAFWFREGRENLMDRISRYLSTRIAAGAFRPVPDVAIAARFILETLVLFAVHRHWDPAPQPMDEPAVKDTLVRFITDALAQE